MDTPRRFTTPSLSTHTHKKERHIARSKRDILDTENMLQQLTKLLQEHSAASELEPGHGFWTRPRMDAESLRRISMTLHRWFEMECGDSNDFSSWMITRGARINGAKSKIQMFKHDDTGSPFIERHYYSKNGPATITYSRIPDRESGARKRLAAIMARYPSLQAYVQTDPRGCALYILKPGDVPAGENADSYYSRGLAVYR